MTITHAAGLVGHIIVLDKLGIQYIAWLTLARNLGGRLNVHPQVIQQFMGMFDNNPCPERPWPKGMSDLDINMALLMDDIATDLRKKLRPKTV